MICTDGDKKAPKAVAPGALGSQRLGTSAKSRTTLDLATPILGVWQQHVNRAIRFRLERTGRCLPLVPVGAKAVSLAAQEPLKCWPARRTGRAGRFRMDQRLSGVSS